MDDKLNLDFSKSNILVIGDVILDKYYLGTVTRISPEAPIPIVNVRETRMCLGGAGNVCNNISKLGGNAFLLGVVGKDSNKNKLNELLIKNNIKGYLIEDQRPTTTKARVVGDPSADCQA